MKIQFYVVRRFEPWLNSSDDNYYIQLAASFNGTTEAEIRRRLSRGEIVVYGLELSNMIRSISDIDASENEPPKKPECDCVHHFDERTCMWFPSDPSCSLCSGVS